MLPIRFALPSLCVLPEAETQKLTFRGSHDLRLGRAYFQKQLPFKPARYRLHHPVCRHFASDEYDYVIRVADKVKPSVFELFVEFIEVDVREYRRERSALCQERDYAKSYHPNRA